VRALKVEDDKDFLAGGLVGCNEPLACARTSACAAQKQTPDTQTQTPWGVFTRFSQRRLGRDILGEAIGRTLA
jgi:hypothetical protein